MIQPSDTPQLTFGIYPGGVAGTHSGLTEGPPDTPSQINLVLDRLQANATHYELFALRDGNSANPDLFHQFGILRDDYIPKPAFETYRRLIAELGR